MHPEHRSIGELAYSLWQSRGCPEGSAEKDWLDAEKQLKTVQRTAEPRGTFSASAPPASAPPASQRAEEPAANADAKRKTAASRKGPAAARPRQSKSTPGKPSAKPPG
jgi:Protein of unknown function (DUF2934)